MDPPFAAAELRRLLANVPDFGGFQRGGDPNRFEWLGKVHAVVRLFDTGAGITISTRQGSLSGISAHANLEAILAASHTVLAALDYEAQRANGGAAFGPGAVYDFHKSLTGLVAMPQKSLMVVDPYLDHEFVSSYLPHVPKGVAIKLLTSNRCLTTLIPATQKFAAQEKAAIDIRVAAKRQIHDRVIIIDEGTCWVAGASFKDAAARAPTYLAPLESEISSEKVAAYSAIWSASPPA